LRVGLEIGKARREVRDERELKKLELSAAKIKLLAG